MPCVTMHSAYSPGAPPTQRSTYRRPSMHPLLQTSLEGMCLRKMLKIWPHVSRYNSAPLSLACSLLGLEYRGQQGSIFHFHLPPEFPNLLEDFIVMPQLPDAPEAQGSRADKGSTSMFGSSRNEVLDWTHENLGNQ